MAVSPDGRQLFSASRREPDILVWDVASGELLQTLHGHNKGVWALLLDSGGKRLFSGSNDKKICEWDVASGKCLRTLQGLVMCLALSPDERFLYSGSWDKPIREWELASGKCKRVLEGHSLGVSSLAVSRDGQTLFSGSRDSTIREWDLASSECKRQHGRTHQSCDGPGAAPWWPLAVLLLWGPHHP